MRKKNGLCLALAALLLMQCFVFGAAATSADDVPAIASQLPTDPTAASDPTQEPTEPKLDISDVPYGTASIKYGCKSIDASVALGGGEKLLDTAKAAFVYEQNSDTVLYSYNPDQLLAPGGLVQIVAAMLVIENCDLDEMVTVNTLYINQLPLGVRHMSLRSGEEISVRDLLYSMMVYAANDAAVVLAQHVAGTPEQFIAMMNQWAKDHGCEDTRITTVSGLDDPGQYSTARDLARILQAAMENETFREVTATGTYVVGATNKSEERELKSTNYFVQDAALAKFYDKRVLGGKASYTSTAAGATIALAAETDELDLICVVIGAARKYAPDGQLLSYGNFEEAEDLLDYCFDGFHVCRLLYRGQSMIQLDVQGGANDVVAMNRSNIDIVLPVDVELDDLIMEYDVVGGKLQAPVKANQEIATLQLWYGESCVGETMLYAMSGVAPAEAPGYTVQDGATRSDEDIAQLLLFLGIALLVILVPLGLWVLIHALRKSIAKRRAKKLRRQRRDERMRRRRSRR